jgi:hypothetical protein
MGQIAITNISSTNEIWIVQHHWVDHHEGESRLPARQSEHKCYSDAGSSKLQASNANILNSILRSSLSSFRRVSCRVPIASITAISGSSHHRPDNNEVSDAKVDTLVATITQSPVPPQLSPESFDNVQRKQLQKAEYERDGARARVTGFRASLRSLATIVTPSTIAKSAKRRSKTTAQADAQKLFGSGATVLLPKDQSTDNPLYSKVVSPASTAADLNVKDSKLWFLGKALFDDDPISTLRQVQMCVVC